MSRNVPEVGTYACSLQDSASLVGGNAGASLMVEVRGVCAQGCAVEPSLARRSKAEQGEKASHGPKASTAKGSAVGS